MSSFMETTKGQEFADALIKRATRKQYVIKVEALTPLGLNDKIIQVIQEEVEKGNWFIKQIEVDGGTHKRRLLIFEKNI